MDVEQGHAGSLTVVAHGRRVGARKGVVAAEFAFAGLADGGSGAIERFDDEANLSDRNFVPYGGERNFRRLGG